ncbi:unnamed protein product [Mytilus coruscus]|uniref:Uncharacterized protein n=1 Tax=Mytilus coruscus TaxID=42192 RepID=A0A6J8DBT0_MYTCO|nr:unnamed protein product [Mytilus coruscus]
MQNKVKDTKLERAQKRHMSPMTSGSSSECNSPKLFRYTPRSNDQQPDPVENLHNCFICDKESPLCALREAMTMKLNQRLVDCAKGLQDRQLLAKLSSGDIIAHEMKYHPSCLAAVYRKREQSTFYALEGQAFAEDARTRSTHKRQRPAIAIACNYNDTMHMAKTAEMICCQLANKKTTFSGCLVSEDIDDSIPLPLLQLVKMIEHGPDIKSQ